MRNNLVGRAHHTSPGVTIVSDGMEAQCAKGEEMLAVFLQRDSWPSAPEQIRNLAALANLRDVSGELIHHVR